MRQNKTKQKGTKTKKLPILKKRARSRSFWEGEFAKRKWDDVIAPRKNTYWSAQWFNLLKQADNATLITVCSSGFIYYSLGKHGEMNYLGWKIIA